VKNSTEVVTMYVGTGIGPQECGFGVVGLSIVELRLWSRESERCGVTAPESWV